MIVSKPIYGLVRGLAGEGRERATAMRDGDGACLTEGGDILGGGEGGWGAAQGCTVAEPHRRPRSA